LPEGRAGRGAHTRKTLAAKQAEFEGICRKYRGDKAVQAFRQRVLWIEKGTRLIIEHLGRVRARALKSTMAGIVGSKEGIERDDDDLGIDLLEFYADYRDRFAKPLPAPQALKARTFLRAYYGMCFLRAQERISQWREQASVFDAGIADEVAKAYMIFAFLRIPDTEWSKREPASLPGWMSDSVTRKCVEEFALAVGRPLTALAIARQRGEKLATPAAICTYLELASTRLSKHGGINRGVQCLRVAAQIAAESGEAALAQKQYVSLAKLYARSGLPLLAAEAARQALGVFPKSTASTGDVMALRLLYLYRGGEFAVVAREGAAYESDARYEGARPWIMFVSCLANRRLHRTATARGLQKRFCQAFPEHPLAANMYWFAASDAIQDGDEREAIHLLDVIEYRFPKSKVMSEVKRLRKILKTTRPK
jgi:tetratricopeptide (TPR) repeat protein